MNRTTLAVIRSSAHGTDLAEMPGQVAKRTPESIRARRQRSAGATPLARMDDHARQDLDPPGAAPRPRFPIL